MNYDYNRRKKSRQQTTFFSIDLQMNLLNTWLKHQVGQYYQNIFLAHLDQLQPKMVEEKVKKEIKNTLQKRTYFYTLEDLNNQRQNILMQLQQLLYNFPQDVNQDDQGLVYEKMKVVREINLQIAETIIRMFQDYHCDNKEMHNRQLKEYICLIDELQESVTFIKESQLKNYMKFGQGFDPFFVNHYQQVHRQQTGKSALKQFYTLNISLVYRLMKAKSKLVDMRAAYQQPPPFKRRQKQTYRFQRLPTLNTEQYNGQSKQSEYGRNRVSVPMMVSPYKRQRSSRTTIHPSYEQRPDSSYTQAYNKSKKYLSKAIDYPDLNERKLIKVKPKKNSIYLHQSKRSAKKYHLNHDQNDLEALSYRHQRQYSVPDESFYKLQPLSHSKNIHSDVLKAKKNVEYKPNHVVKTGEPDKVIQIKNYNPVKGQSFQVTLTPRSNNKYDYNPNHQHNFKLYPNERPQIDEKQRKGLQYQSPLSKYNIKSKLPQRQINKQPQKAKPQPSLQKIDRQIQTNQMKQVDVKQQNPKKPVQKVENNKPVTQNFPQKMQHKPKSQQPLRDKDDQTIEFGDIIDERPDYIQQSSKKPLIREVSRQSSSPTNTKSQKRQQQPSNIKQNEDKKEIKMKVGKLTLKQILQLVQNIKILANYQNLFDKQKLIPWLKTSQTYLTQFHINDKCAIVALASPIPNMGTTIKLWAPINGIANESISMNLFPKYIQYIEKTTTADKIIYNGNGSSFKELNVCDFTMKRQNLYQRLRKLPPKATYSEFKPFLYTQCSIVNFPQNTKQSMIYSQQIEQFNQKNCYLAKFLGEIDVNRIPQTSKSLIKISENVSNFKEVNKILVNQAFDQYQASQIKATNIKLLRLYFNSPLRSTFLTGDGFLKFVGTLLYQQNQKCLISINTLKNNGVMFFSKGMSCDDILQKSKIISTMKVNFCVKMFTKKLYGKLVNFIAGSYGNFEINLTFQDEMQGKIKHNMKVQRTFGPQLFIIGVQIDKQILFCVTVGEDDFIY